MASLFCIFLGFPIFTHHICLSFNYLRYRTYQVKLPHWNFCNYFNRGGGSLTWFSKKNMKSNSLQKKIFKKTKKRPKLKLVEILRSTTILSGFDNESVDQNGWVEHLVSSNSGCLYVGYCSGWRTVG